jgi:hypothetical protein
MRAAKPALDGDRLPLFTWGFRFAYRSKRRRILGLSIPYTRASAFNAWPTTGS